jgi:DNA helicase HerA-like ATPase
MKLHLDITRHALIVGKTGSGKSTLLRALASDLMASGYGLLLVDPHGDLAEQVITDVPRRRKNDLVLMRAADPADCPGLNPLRGVPSEQRAVVVSGLLATLSKVWPDNWGPRTQHVLRNILLALLEIRGATLLDAPPLLTDPAVRRWVVGRVKDETVRRFWSDEFPGYGKNLGADAAAPVLNKLGALLASPSVRAVVTKRRPQLDARRAMDCGRIVVASLPKGLIGEEASLILGGLLLGSFQQAALARANVAVDARKPFAVLVDEAASFATGPFVGLMSEARKYGVGLVLATQSVAALDQQLRAQVLGNVGTLVSFLVGADDAEMLSREFAGDVPPRTLMRLRLGELVVRMGAESSSLISPHLSTPPT